MDADGRKKEAVNPLSYLPNYLQRLSGVASTPRMRNIYTKPRYKRSIWLYITQEAPVDTKKERPTRVDN